jgi:hypothetical protein
MKFTFKYRTRAFDLWQLSMYGIYASMLGLVNIIFTIAMILLSIQFWTDVTVFIKLAMVISMCLFTVIQPLAVLFKAKKQASLTPYEFEITFEDKGIHIKTEKASSDLKWSAIGGILKKSSLIVVLSSEQHGFILNNKVLGDQKTAFYDYVRSKIK